jgi:gas vesicle protein
MSNRIFYSREAQEQVAREKFMSVVLFMILGLGVGTVLALLFAPRSGEKTRRELSNAIEGQFSDMDFGKRFSSIEKELSGLAKRFEERLTDR